MPLPPGSPRQVRPRFSAGPGLVRLLLALLLVGWGRYGQAQPQPQSGRPVVIVGGGDQNPPYAFVDAQGEPAGYDVDLSRAIADTMGLRITFRLGEWSTIRQALANGQVDLLQGMYYSEERARSVDFSVPNYVTSYAVYARKGAARIVSMNDLRDRDIIVQRGSLMDDYLAAHHIGRHVVAVASQADALRLLASGQGDCSAVGMLAGTYILQAFKLTNLVPVARGIGPVHYHAFATRKGDSALLDTFNEGLAILKQTGRYQKIRDKWLGEQEPAGIPWKLLVKYSMVGFIPLLLLLACALLWSRTLKRQVDRRTLDLEREVQERRLAEHRLLLHQQELVQADKMAALGVLVSGVAHEINNPNGLILISLPFLRRYFRDALPILDDHARGESECSLAGLPYAETRAEIPKLIDEMLDGANRIKRIVNDLKDFARRDDAGGKVPEDFNRIVEVAVRLVEPTIRKATHQFSLELGPELPLVLCNTQRVEQIIVNLILNACQALPDPERKVHVATWFDPAAGAVRLTVADEGVGVAPEDLGRLTDPFFTTKRDRGGTGLGLSVSAGIAKEHNGRLDFQSRPGHGTTVTLSLPAAPQDCDP